MIHKKTKKVEIFGIVQGVGFRPFIYNLALKYLLKGFVQNSSKGVELEIEGEKEKIGSFLKDIKKKAPPLSVITKIVSKDIEFKDYKKFSILLSHKSAYQKTLVSYDIGICEDCLSELFNSDDRRFLYPFINCTNCGPRYTIIEELPYDRKNSSMKKFKMCEKCQKEYDDPTNRRFHAQPNACFKCGPMVFLLDKDGKKIKVKNPIKECANFLKQGHIVAIKGLGGFHLSADATNDEAILNIRKKKNRETKPLALMVADINSLKEFAFVNKEEEKLLTSPHKPIVLVKKKATLSKAVSPDNNYIGVMIAYTPLHQILFKYGLKIVVMTSGNKKDEPLAIDNNEALKSLKNIASFFLMHNRDIYTRNDDSIVKTVGRQKIFLRRARGYVPVPIFLNKKYPTTLAYGSDLKNSICFIKNNDAFLSQYLGDMEHPKAFSFLKETILHIQNTLDINPDIIACDKHPNYFTTLDALKQKKKIIQVQHHHSHIVSCMAENNIWGDVIGIAFDGTGFGEDGNMWGGEFLICNEKSFLRKAHFNYVSMIGGDMAAKEPYRMGISLLFNAYGEDFSDINLPFLKAIDKNKIYFFLNMIKKNINTPLTSSVGRFFDGVAAILNLKHINSFEGEAPMLLEMKVKKGVKTFYDYYLKGKGLMVIKTEPIIKGIVDDILNGLSEREISSKLHNTFVKISLDICIKIKKETSLDRVVLSGGVFQNTHLLKLFIREFKKEKFKLFFHSKVPTNDGGLSLGQAVIAAELCK